jgi:hypothetical protein
VSADLPYFPIRCFLTACMTVLVLRCLTLPRLPIFRQEAKQINHRKRIVPSPFPSAPVKVIRHKPGDGILTTRKHKPTPPADIHQPADPDFPGTPPSRPPPMRRVALFLQFISPIKQPFKTPENETNRLTSTLKTWHFRISIKTI